MPKQEAPLVALQSYLPEAGFDEVLYFLEHYKVHLTISRKRQSILGDYRHAHTNKNHRISVNGNLNKFAFLITLLHELAHLLTFELYGNRVAAHGKEWKGEFGKMLARFLQQNVFPPDVEKALMKTLQNPAASSCGDENLLRVLRNYDEKTAGILLVEQVPEGTVFSIKGGRRFKKGVKVRKRYKCVEEGSGKLYLFSGLYEVQVSDL